MKRLEKQLLENFKTLDVKLLVNSQRLEEKLMERVKGKCGETPRIVEQVQEKFSQEILFMPLAVFCSEQQPAKVAHQ